jgi:hypothetical protein
MKIILPLLVLGLTLVPKLASAGPLYGSVRTDQGPVAAVTVLVACPGFQASGQSPSTADAITDARGSYSLRVQARGRCEMRVRRDRREGKPFQVFVSDNPLHLDFEIDNALNRVR